MLDKVRMQSNKDNETNRLRVTNGPTIGYFKCCFGCCEHWRGWCCCCCSKIHSSGCWGRSFRGCRGAGVERMTAQNDHQDLDRPSSCQSTDTPSQNFELRDRFCPCHYQPHSSFLIFLNLIAPNDLVKMSAFCNEGSIFLTSMPFGLRCDLNQCCLIA